MNKFDFLKIYYKYEICTGIHSRNTKVGRHKVIRFIRGRIRPIAKGNVPLMGKRLVFVIFPHNTPTAGRYVFHTPLLITIPSAPSYCHAK